MKSCVFITTEGLTYQPNIAAIEPNIDNCQVIGYGEGKDETEAFKNMIRDHKYLLKTNFDEIICLELKNQKRHYFYLSEHKKRRK